MYLEREMKKRMRREWAVGQPSTQLQQINISGPQGPSSRFPSPALIPFLTPPLPPSPLSSPLFSWIWWQEHRTKGGTVMAAVTATMRRTSGDRNKMRWHQLLGLAHFLSICPSSPLPFSHCYRMGSWAAASWWRTRSQEYRMLDLTTWHREPQGDLQSK